MNILFSPEYSGHLYVDTTSNGVLMDTIALNTIGLLEMIELRLGLHYPTIVPEERVAKYYNAMTEYIKHCPDSIFSKSFNISGLATAKAVLAWRDELKMAQWNFEPNRSSKRLKAIAEIEKYFSKEKEYDITERINLAINQINSRNLDCSAYSLWLNCDSNALRPIVRLFIKTLEDNGAILNKLPIATSDSENNLFKVRKLLTTNYQEDTTLDSDDDSILIYKFPDEHAAFEYFSVNDKYHDAIWINNNNKAMDHWFALANKPYSGSKATNCSPQLTQLFVAGIRGLFSTPLNIKSLIDWLNMPIHPLDRYLRERLSYTIARTGGYKNKECRELIEKYIDGEFEYIENKEKKTDEEIAKLKKIGKGKRKNNIEIFLPSIDSCKTISNQKLKDFCLEFSSWSSQKVAIMDQKDTLWKEQLAVGTTMARVFYMLLSNENNDTINNKTIESWLNVIYDTKNYTNTIAEQNCSIVVDAPEKIVSSAEKIIWLSFNGLELQKSECNFLSPTEKEQLIKSEGIKNWDSLLEQEYNESLHKIPFLHAKRQLILVVCERKDGNLLPKHPLLLRLEAIRENFTYPIERRPTIDDNKLKDTNKIIKENTPVQIKFDNPELIKWPNYITPTTIETLVEHPADFLMNNLLDINPDEMAQMEDVKRTSGNVAHAVIEALFAPSNATTNEIKARIENEYNEVYQKAIEEKGAILLLKENKLEEEKLKYKLKNCINNLYQIIVNNNLIVSGCEKRFTTNLNLGLPKRENEEQYDVLGNIDMTLTDKNGDLVIFDFKWTTRKKHYTELLNENRSIQLEIYRRMLADTEHKRVKAVGYFIMPEGILYSTTKFEGRNCITIDCDNNDNIVEQLRQSIIYRKEQISKGILETTGPMKELDYEKDRLDKGLYPLKEDSAKNGEKAENKYTNYKIIIPR